MEPANRLQPISIWLDSLSSSMKREADSGAGEARESKAAAIMALLGKLALHYWRPDFTPGQAKQVYADYVEHLLPYPMVEIAASIKCYQASPDSNFYPSIGRLLQPMTSAPAWYVGSGAKYAAELRAEAEKELQAVQKKIGAGRAAHALPAP